MRWPPKKYRVRKGGPMKILGHWVARVAAVSAKGELSLTMWPSNWKDLPGAKEADPISAEAGCVFCCIEPDGKTYTAHGALHENAPCEVWEWEQGKVGRVHVESIWVRS